MPTPAEREYAVFRRGQVREAILQDFRAGLRLLTDPATGLPFTEDTLRRATAHGSRFYREADAIDLVLLGVQKRDEFLAQQIRIDRAGSAFLRSYHAELWGEAFLPAFGGSGTVSAHGTAGTTWQGSTTVPDAFAVTGTDPAGNRYQVLASATADADGDATLTLIAIDGGVATNIAIGTKIKWVNPPPGSDPEATVTDNDFRGGLDAETDADFAARLAARVRHKPASGNWAHFRAFARQASVSVEDAFVYPCAFYAGSVLVAITQKRGSTQGPLARVPSSGVLSAVTGLLVPPGSPVIPGRAHVVVLPVQTEASDLVVHLAQPLGSDAGWADLEPFPPANGASACTLVFLNSQTNFLINTGITGQLPGGVTGPIGDVHLMVWDPETSTFEALNVLTVEDIGAGAYEVVLAQAPAKTLAVGDWFSPDMARRDVLAAGLVAYFDSLGPGEVIDLENDERSVRAYRNPVTSEEYPSRAGQSALTYLADALGSPLSDATLASISLSNPSMPDDPIDGPNLIVAGKFAVYHLE
jgi:hypothetical protein